MKKIILNGALIFGLIILSSSAWATTYYISVNGNDSNSGTSSTSPWLSIAKVNAATFNPGDSILFQGGQTFTGCLVFSPTNIPNSSATNPVTVNSYGTGNFILNSNCSGAQTAAVLINNVNGVTLENATISANGNATQFGIWIYNTASAVNSGITVKNSDISGFYYPGTDNYGAEIFVSSLNGGGLNNIQILDNVLHGAAGLTSHDDDGIAGYGTNENVTNVLYQGNTVYNIGGKPNGELGTEGNGIVANGVNGGIVQYNLVYNNGANSNTCGGPTGFMAYSANNVTFQYNEAYGMQPNPAIAFTVGSCDWDGFDLDGYTTNSVVQYNYAHDNWGAGFLAWIGGTWSGNTYRYNIAQNNSMTAASSYFGQVTIVNDSSNAALNIYNNTLYSNAPSTGGPLLAIQGNPVGTTISNNIFYSNNGTQIAATGVNTAPTVTMTGNDYYAALSGTFTIRWSAYNSSSDTGYYYSLASFQSGTGQEMMGGTATGTTANPNLNNPGNGGTCSWTPTQLLGPQPCPSAYALNSGSSMIGTGLNLYTNYSLNVGSRDYYANTVPNELGTGFNIGAYGAEATTTSTPPTVPTGLAATAASATQINLTWTASTDAVGVTGYNVYRNGTRVGTATSTSYSDTGLTASTTYSYTVSAYDAAGNVSAQSSSVSATTPASAAPPTVPTNLKATVVSATQINLTWTASTDTLGVQGYDIYNGSSGALIATSSTTSYSATGLTSGTSYSFAVAAYDSAGHVSSLSSVVSATTTAAPAPTVPKGLTATVASAAQINLTWTASTDTGSTVTGYNIYRNSTKVGTSTTTSYSDTGLTATTTYSYTVSAYNAAGTTSAQSSSVSATTSAAAAPTVPTGLAATAASSTQINLTWTASTDAGTTVTGYNVYRNGTKVGTSTTTSYSDTGLTATTTYSYTVSAYNTAGTTSAQSSSVSATTTVVAPTVPTSLAARVASATQINLTWTASTDVGAAVTGYNVYRNSTKVGTSTTTSYSDTGLTASTAYSYTVSAYTAAGITSAQSSSVSATTSAAAAPTVPTGLAATAASATQINLTWTASTDAGATVTGYNVYRNGTRVGTSTTTSYSDTGLTANTAYSYTVSAYNAAGTTSAQSSSVSATTQQSATGSAQAASQIQTIVNNMNTYMVGKQFASGWNDITVSLEQAGVIPSTMYPGTNTANGVWGNQVYVISSSPTQYIIYYMNIPSASQTDTMAASVLTLTASTMADAQVYSNGAWVDIKSMSTANIMALNGADFTGTYNIPVVPGGVSQAASQIQTIVNNMNTYMVGKQFATGWNDITVSLEQAGVIPSTMYPGTNTANGVWGNQVYVISSSPTQYIIYYMNIPSASQTDALAASTLTLTAPTMADAQVYSNGAWVDVKSLSTSAIMALNGADLTATYNIPALPAGVSQAASQIQTIVNNMNTYMAGKQFPAGWNDETVTLEQAGVIPSTMYPGTNTANGVWGNQVYVISSSPTQYIIYYMNIPTAAQTDALAVSTISSTAATMADAQVYSNGAWVDVKSMSSSSIMTLNGADLTATYNI